jgi:hypothetical protein
MAMSMTPSHAVTGELEATHSVRPGDQFYIDAPTTANELVDRRKKDSARIQYLKHAIPVLVEKISTLNPEATYVSLVEERTELMQIFREVFRSNKIEQLNVFRMCIQRITTSGEARLFKTIVDSKDVTKDEKKLMKKIVLDEIMRRC